MLPLPSKASEAPLRKRHRALLSARGMTCSNTSLRDAGTGLMRPCSHTQLQWQLPHCPVPLQPTDSLYRGFQVQVLGVRGGGRMCFQGLRQSCCWCNGCALRLRLGSKSSHLASLVGAAVC